MNFLATLNTFFLVNETAIVITAVVALILFQLIMFTNVYTAETVEPAIVQPEVTTSGQDNQLTIFDSMMIYAPRGLVNKF